MYKRLLVPLDGSQLAESILPVAVCLARSLNATVTLVHIIERNAPLEIHGEEHLHDVSSAEAYLGRVAEQWFTGVTAVETHVHSEEVANVARSILQHVTETDSDLTLMCTHGHSGARQFLYGSIAQQIAAAAVPVLFVRTDSTGGQTEFTLHRFLVPLDGDPEHEQGLAVAAELARACGAAIHLLTVVPSINLVSGSWTQSVRLLPSTTDRMLRMEAGEAEQYLQGHQRKLETMSLAVTTEVLRGDPAEEIVKASSAPEIDLVVLGTHGTVGTKAFWSGSVTAKVARRTLAPVLLIPAVVSAEESEDNR
jgi:nucleotide-binding universal stress UspA family protein